MAAAQTQERIALVVLWGAIAYCWFGLLTPARSSIEYLTNPAYCAMAGATLSAALYSAIHIVATHSELWRRRLLALFLAGMPLIYLWGAILVGDTPVILLEIVGAFIFIPMAVFGYRKSMLVLGVGIAAHGIAWDLWHHHRATYMEPWYPIGCLVVDLSLCLVVLAYAFGGKPMAIAKQEASIAA